MPKRDTINKLNQDIKLYTRKITLFKQLETRLQADFLQGASSYLQTKIINKLPEKEILEILNFLDPDEVVRIIRKIKKASSRKKIIEKLKKNTKSKVEFLLKFDPSAAVSMMSFDFVQIKENSTFEDVSKIIHIHEKSTGKTPALLVIKEGRLLGELPIHKLATARPKQKIKDHIQKIPKINYRLNQKEVVNIFKSHPHNKVVVLDDDNSILGIIYSDDILNLIEKQANNSLRNFAGVKKEEDVFDSSFYKVKNRYKWLTLNLGTSFLAASVVGLFEDVISAFTLLAIYMPIVAGMGGNAGTQTLAVTVRGIALKEIELKNAKKVIINEMFAGTMNGIINGVLVSIIALFLNKTPLIGMIVGAALIVNLTVAGLFGATIPLIMKQLGKDPAASATIFITTATDVFGFFTFLGLAKFILM